MAICASYNASAFIPLHLKVRTLNEIDIDIFSILSRVLDVHIKLYLWNTQNMLKKGKVKGEEIF